MRGRRDRLWMTGAGGLVAAAAAFVSHAVFGRIPHVQDSVAQLFQARIFASGRLWAPSPPLPEFFAYPHVINDGRWYAQYPPGHALLLTPGVWLGVPWLINPLLAGLGTAAVYLLAREVYDRRVASWAALLALLSPFLIFMAGGMMSHVGAFCLLTLHAWLLLRAVRTGGVGSGVAAGACLAGAVLVRPYAALAGAAPLVLWAGVRVLRGGGAARRAVWCAVGGGLAGLLLYALYNWGTTGAPWRPGYIELYGPEHGLGFGQGSWGPPHTLARGLTAAHRTLSALNAQLFLWPLSSLWPVALALLPVMARRAPAPRGVEPPQEQPSGGGRLPGRRFLLAAVPGALLAAYVFYWYHDFCFGPRYVYDALGPLLVLAAAGLLRAGEGMARLAQRTRLVAEGDGPRRRAGSFAAALLLGVLTAGAAAHGWPALVRAPGEAATAAPGTAARIRGYFLAYGPQYWGVSPYLGRLVARAGLEQALVFTRFTEPQRDFLPVRHIWFGSAFAHQEPDLARAAVVYAHDRGAENGRLMALFPERRAYIYHGTIEAGRLLPAALSPPGAEDDER